MAMPCRHHRARRHHAGDGAICSAAVSAGSAYRRSLMSTFGLEHIFSAKSVVVVGGSPRPCSIGAIVLQNLTKGGFSGQIAAVSHRYDSIGGRKTYPKLRRLPFVPDLVVITARARP